MPKSSQFSSQTLTTLAAYSIPKIPARGIYTRGFQNVQGLQARISYLRNERNLPALKTIGGGVDASGCCDKAAQHMCSLPKSRPPPQQ